MALGHSRPTTKEDLINVILGYVKEELNKRSYEKLHKIAFKLILREQKKYWTKAENRKN